MDKLIEKIGLDKFAHIGIGGLICAMITFVVILQDANLIWQGHFWNIVFSPTIGMISVIILELIKEALIDMKFSVKDFLYTISGCLLVYIAVLIGMFFYTVAN